jgi:hypothetical protein
MLKSRGPETNQINALWHNDCFRFVSDHQADYPIASMCRLLGVSSSGYYAWMKRRPSRRAETDAALIGEIRAAHAASLGAYGAPRIHAELTAKGMQQCWSVVHWGLCWASGSLS